MAEKDKGRVARMFNELAPVYDLGNHLLSLGLDFRWRKRLAKELGKYQPESVLDLASGTADLAIAIKKRLPEALTVGIDLAAKMLARAGRKIARSGPGGSIALALADVEDLPFADQSFSAASIGFGVRNLEARPRGLSEILRVLRPGGVLAVLEFSMPEKGWFAGFYRIYLGMLLPWIGKILSGKASYFYLRDTIAEFPSPAEFAAELEAAGFLVKQAASLSRGAVWLYVAEKREK